MYSGSSSRFGIVDGGSGSYGQLCDCRMIPDPDVDASICIFLGTALDPNPASIAFGGGIGVVQRKEQRDGYARESHIPGKSHLVRENQLSRGERGLDKMEVFRQRSFFSSI